MHPQEKGIALAASLVVLASAALTAWSWLGAPAAPPPRNAPSAAVRSSLQPPAPAPPPPRARALPPRVALADFRLDGTMSRAGLEDAVYRQLDRFERCYRASGEREPVALRVTLVVSGGGVDDVSLDEGAGGAALRGCAREALGQLRGLVTAGPRARAGFTLELRPR